MKSIRNIILIICMMAVTFAFSICCYAASYVKYDEYKTGQSTALITVRESASASADSMGKIKKSTKITIKGYKNVSDKKWYRITYSGKAGYVNSKYVKIIDKVPYVIYTPYQTGKPTSALTVRTGASAEKSSPGKLSKAQSFTVKGYKEGANGTKWYVLTYGGKTAYVNGNYVTRSDTFNYEIYTPSKALIAGTKGAAVRESASSTAKKLGTLNESSTYIARGFKYASDGSKWSVVSYGDKRGYIKTGNSSNAGDISWTPYTPCKAGEISAEGAAVRKSASSSSELIAKCSKGTQFTLKGYKKDSDGQKWYRVTYSGKAGFINAKQVDTISAETATILTPYNSAKTAKNGVKVMESPSETSKSYATLGSGIKFTIRGFCSRDSGKWYRVTYAGKKAYVKSSELTSIDRTSYVIYTPYKTAAAGTSGAAIRKSASSSADKYVTLKSGTEMTLLGYLKDSDGNTMYRLAYDGNEAYVNKSAVEIKGNSSYSIYLPVRYKKVGEEGAKVYEKASATAKSPGILNDRTVIPVYAFMKDGSGTTWYRTSYDGDTAYVKSTKVGSVSKPEYTPYVPFKTGEVSSAKGISVYDEASGSSDKLGTAVKNTQFAVRGYKSVSGTKYYYVVYSGKSAYVKASDISIIDRVSYVPYSPVKKGTAKGSATVRKTVSTTGTKLATVKEGTVFGIKGYESRSTGCWYRVTYDGKAGYVKASDIDVSGTIKYIPYTPVKNGVTEESVNLRESASSSSDRIATLSKGEAVKINGYRFSTDGDKWYRVTEDGKTGYIMAKYVELTTGSLLSSDDFEKYMTDQGFPASYKPYLRKLHEEHPTWKFKAQKTGVSWDDVVSAETSNIKRNLYNGSYSSWKSMEKGAYDFSKGSYVSFDGAGWVAAYKGLTKYYLDPRNFLNEEYIYMFMDQSFDSASQSIETVKKIVKGTFMEGSFPESTYSTYASCIYYAGKAADMNPNVLAAMIIQEQGASGKSSLISGNVSGYKGYYNYLNIGAYTTSTMSAVQRGLWWAKGAGTGATSYSRPWNTRAKAIKGGAKYYAEGYINQKQNTLYLKKFNVMNGKSNLGLHQYMTNVQGAAGEASLMKNAYSSISGASITFSIPVFSDMPSSAVKQPSKTGNNNNLLDSLKVSGYSLSSSFTRYTTKYTVTVSSSVSSIKVTAVANASGAKVSGTGTISLESGTNTVKVVCKATSGVTRTYTITVKRS